jgi:hypothetical protein
MRKEKKRPKKEKGIMLIHNKKVVEEWIKKRQKRWVCNLTNNEQVLLLSK